MKAHELARQLLKLPDYEVIVCGNTSNPPIAYEHFSAERELTHLRARISDAAIQTIFYNEDGSVEMVVILDLKNEGCR